MSTELERAQAAFEQASRILTELKAEQSVGAETLRGQSMIDLDKLTSIAERQKALPELIFKASIEVKRAHLAVLEIKKEILRADLNKAVSAQTEKEPAIHEAIAKAEAHVLQLKHDLSVLVSTRNAAERELHVLSGQIVDAERELRLLIQNDALSEPNSVNTSNWRFGMDRLGDFGRLA